MKNLKYQIINIALIFIVFLSFSRCENFFDPIEDNETGKDITLMILDMNFFTTRVTYKFVDASEDFLITSPATITFTGKNANDIITFAGKKKQVFTSSVGQLELTVDPNVEFSESNPFEFAVNVEIEGYTPMSKGVQFSTTGIKTVEVRLSKLSDEEDEDINGEIGNNGDETTFYFSAPWSNGLKSASAVNDIYDVNYNISLTSILKFLDLSGNKIFADSTEAMNAYHADSANFIVLSRSFYNDYDPWIDLLNVGDSTKSVIFHLLETSTINQIRVAGTVVGNLNGGMVYSSAVYSGSPTPDFFGFAQFDGSYTISGTDTIYYEPTFSYKLVKASDDVLCSTGTNIIFNSSVTSSFSITADVYDKQNPPQLLNTINFTGNFPDTFAVENTPSIPVTLVFRDNNPAFKPISDLEIDNFCIGSETVTVEPEADYEEYQIVLTAHCSNTTIAVAPTYSGEFRMANSDSIWQGTSMIGGVVDLLGLPNQEYEYRLLWENEWEYTTIWTEFNANGDYLHDTDSQSITSELLPDGRIKISIEHEFKESVCQDLGWINQNP